MTTIDPVASTGTGRSGQMPADDSGETASWRGSGCASPIGPSVGFRTPTSSSAWRSSWWRRRRCSTAPPPVAVTKAFGDGFWSLITFTMQMAMIVVIAATWWRPRRRSPSSSMRSRRCRATGAPPSRSWRPSSMLASLLNWGMSLIFSGLLVRALARRTDLRMDYRAAGAAGYLGLGATWALGLSSSAAQLQANRGEPAASRCSRSPASFRSRRRFSCGSRWRSPRSCWSSRSCSRCCRRPPTARR